MMVEQDGSYSKLVATTRSVVVGLAGVVRAADGSVSFNCSSCYFYLFILISWLATIINFDADASFS
jgi:hypothetical protein